MLGYLNMKKYFLWNGLLFIINLQNLVNGQLAPEFTRRASGADLISLQLANSLDGLEAVSKGTDIISEFINQPENPEADNLFSFQDIGKALGSLSGGLGSLGDLGSLVPGLGGEESSPSQTPSLLPTYVPRSSTSATPNNNLLNFHFNFPPGGGLPSIGSVPPGPTQLLSPVANLRSEYDNRDRPVNVHIHNEGKRDLSRELLSVLSPRERDLLFDNVQITDLLTANAPDQYPDPKDPSWRIGRPDTRAQLSVEPDREFLYEPEKEEPSGDSRTPTRYTLQQNLRSSEQSTNRGEENLNELGILIDSDFESLHPVIPRTDDLNFGQSQSQPIGQIPDRVYEVGNDRSLKKIPNSSHPIEKKLGRSPILSRPGSRKLPKTVERQQITNDGRSNADIDTKLKKIHSRPLIPRTDDLNFGNGETGPVVEELSLDSTSFPTAESDEDRVLSYRDRIVQNRNPNSARKRQEKQVELRQNRNENVVEKRWHKPVEIIRQVTKANADLDFNPPLDINEAQVETISQRRPARKNILYPKDSSRLRSKQRETVDHDSRTLDVFTRNLPKDDIRNGERVLRVFTPDSPRPGDQIPSLGKIFLHKNEVDRAGALDVDKSGSSLDPPSIEDLIFINPQNPESINHFFDSELIQKIPRLPKQSLTGQFEKSFSFQLPSESDSAEAQRSYKTANLSPRLVSILPDNKYDYETIERAELPSHQVSERNPPTPKSKFLDRFEIIENDFFPNSFVSPTVTAFQLQEAENLHSGVKTISPIVPKPDDLLFGEGAGGQRNLNVEYLSDESEPGKRTPSEALTLLETAVQPKTEVRSRHRLPSSGANGLQKLSEAIDAYAALTVSPGSPLLSESDSDPEVVASITSESMQAIEAAAKALKIQLSPATKRLLEKQFSRMVRLHKHVSKNRKLPSSSENRSSIGQNVTRLRLTPEQEIKKILNDISHINPDDAGALLSYRPLIRLRELLNQNYPLLKAQIAQQKQNAALKKHRRQIYLQQLVGREFPKSQEYLLNQQYPVPQPAQSSLTIKAVHSQSLPITIDPAGQELGAPSQLKLARDKRTGLLYGVSATGEIVPIQEQGPSSINSNNDPYLPQLESQESQFLTYVVRRPVHKFEALDGGPARPAVVEAGRFPFGDNESIESVPSIQDDVDKIVTEAGFNFLPQDSAERDVYDTETVEVKDNTDLLGILGPEFPNRLNPKRSQDGEYLDKRDQSDQSDQIYQYDLGPEQELPKIDIQHSSPQSRPSDAGGPVSQLNKLLSKARDIERSSETSLNPQDFFKRFFEVTEQARDAIILASNKSNLSEIDTTTEAPTTTSTTSSTTTIKPLDSYTVTQKRNVVPSNTRVSKIADFTIVLNTPKVPSDYAPSNPGPPSFQVNPPSINVGPPGLQVSPPSPISPPGHYLSPPSSYNRLNLSSKSKYTVPTAFVTSHRELSRSVVSPPSPSSGIYEPIVDYQSPPAPQLPYAPSPSSTGAFRGPAAGYNTPPASYTLSEDDPFNPNKWQWGGQATDPFLTEFSPPDALNTQDDLIHNFPIVKQNPFSWDYGLRDSNFRPRNNHNQLAALGSFGPFSGQVSPPSSDFNRHNSNLHSWSQDWGYTDFKRKQIR